MDEIKLLPCPFCGYADISIKLHLQYLDIPYIECNSCRIEVGYADCIRSAINLWNTRHETK